MLNTQWKFQGRWVFTGEPTGRSCHGSAAFRCFDFTGAFCSRSCPEMALICLERSSSVRHPERGGGAQSHGLGNTSGATLSAGERPPQGRTLQKPMDSIEILSAKTKFARTRAGRPLGGLAATSGRSPAAGNCEEAALRISTSSSPCAQSSRLQSGCGNSKASSMRSALGGN
jgi:hypothetical protein